MLRRLCALIGALALLATPASPGAAQPAGFVEELAVDGVDAPTALAFLPDGRMLITSKGGQLHLADGGALLSPPALDIAGRICVESERGLLGVAVDPAFAQNGFIYVYYTARRGDECTRNQRDTDPVNRVARFTLADGRAGDELILIDNIPSPNGNHNGGDLHVGKDGHLYISVGDGGRDYGGGSAGSNDAARDRHTLLGKILRITREGGIPPGNPFTDPATSGRCYDRSPGGNRSGSTTPGKHCQETFAWGLRNPYRIAFDPNAPVTRFFINDVGQGRSEEIDEGRAGADYGWNCLEGTLTNSTGGPCAADPPADPAPPLFEYRRDAGAPDEQPAFFDGCASITGGAFVPRGVWPAAYDGAYLFGDFVCSRIFALTPDGQGLAASLLVDEGRAPTHMAFGPYGETQALYYTDYFGDQIRRVRYAGAANRAPTAALSAAPRSGSAPLEVAFDAAESRDPDAGDRIVAFLWDFGDGRAAETAGPTTAHTYATAGSFSASVRARDSRGALSAPASLTTDAGNDPPQPVIDSPAAGQLFSAGETISLRGGASDPQEGALPGERLSWEVRQRHADHFHPYHEAAGAGSSFVAPGPEDLTAVENSYLEIRLTAADALGRTTTVTRELRPRLVRLSFETRPAGLRVIVDGGTNGNTLTGPASLRSWPGYDLQLDVPGGQRLNGQAMRFCGWSQGGPARQALTTPAADARYVASFAAEGRPCPSQAPEQLRLFLPLLRR